MSKRVLFGTVDSTISRKTVKVLVLRICKDRLYKKVIKKYKSYIVHDENNSCKRGDKVLIQEHRPISATKRWVVTQAIN